MADKKVVGQLVDYYYDLTDTIESIEIIGRVSSEEIAMLNDLRIDLDKILTNISKRWAKGKRDRNEKTDLETPRAL